MQLVGVLLILAALCLAAGLLYLVFDPDRRRRRARPSWAKLMADTDYYQSVLNAIFQMQGYAVVRCVPAPDPIERVPRELVFELERAGRPVMALCGRWVVPITSEQISRFETALAHYPGAEGLLMTTSYFSDGAIERARPLAGVTLYDRVALQEWIAEFWPD